ncbi:ankyrin repeat domain-containing protein [Dechloromonas denitrificans]|nr:ankyrin repeat domain-containing protein [Dechloromonas denitrificans]
MLKKIFALLLSLLLGSSVALADATLGAHDHAIHDAARGGSGQDVARLLKAEPSARDLRTAQGSTPLHLAATNPDPAALKALIAAGADANARDVDGLTPLHMAAYTQNARHAQLLLEAGADPYAKTNAGRDPTSMARKVMANEVAGVISLWILKGCKAGKPC